MYIYMYIYIYIYVCSCVLCVVSFRVSDTIQQAHYTIQCHRKQSRIISLCCSLLQCVAVCCSVLQHVQMMLLCVSIRNMTGR